MNPAAVTTGRARRAAACSPPSKMTDYTGPQQKQHETPLNCLMVVLKYQLGAAVIQWVTLGAVPFAQGPPESPETPLAKTKSFHSAAVLHTQLLDSESVGKPLFAAAPCQLALASSILDDSTFCLLRRVQFFHSNRRIWEPVFIAPQLHPWRGSWD